MNTISEEFWGQTAMVKSMIQERGIKFNQRKLPAP
jgi:hypothetical protein